MNRRSSVPLVERRAFNLKVWGSTPHGGAVLVCIQPSMSSFFFFHYGSASFPTPHFFLVLSK